jgi:CYTH domain-containing protein
MRIGSPAHNEPMATEIERVFLVADPSAVSGAIGTPIRQGYLSVDPDRVVRVRRTADAAWLTIKGRAVGPARPEFEYPIPPDDADVILALCRDSIVSKHRHRLPAGGGLTWEIDVFRDANDGLVLAEIELPSADTPFERPAWLGAEVTDDHRYRNASLAARPFTTWSEGP